MTDTAVLHAATQPPPLAVKAAPPALPLSADDAPPRSAVSAGTGMAGCIALAILLVAAYRFSWGPLEATFILLAGTAAAMALWSVGMERVHQRASTGLDFSLERSTAQLSGIVAVKTLGFAATLGLLSLGYFTFRNYAQPSFGIYLWSIVVAFPALLVASPFYIALTSRYMSEPKDGLWHFGMLVLLRFEDLDREKIADHLRSWAIKGFFLAFMFSVMPGSVAAMLRLDVQAILTDPLQTILFVVRVAFLFDIVFGTIGYIVTSRLLDSHIRSANPYAAGWAAALICYPPFVIMGTGGPMDYRHGGLEWLDWLRGYDTLLILWALAIAALAAVYAWATVIFGLRFSNLTNRGIITNGPYRYFKHPAYVAKNLMWWCIHLPFLTTLGAEDAVRNTLLLVIVNIIYYLRARTEERHLMADPDYQAYSAWIARHGVLERLGRRLHSGLWNKG